MEQYKGVEDEHWILSDSKDRAQLSVVGAMTVILVPIVKNKFVAFTTNNPNNVPYYEVLFALMVMLFAIQLIVGFIIIRISQMHANRDKFRETSVCCGILTDCCFCIATDHERDDRRRSLINQMFLERRRRDAGSDAHQGILAQVIYAELSAAQAEIEQTYMLATIGDAKSQLRNLNTGKNGDKVKTLQNRMISETNAQLREAQAMKANQEVRAVQMHVLQKKGALMYQKLESLDNEALVTKILFWQNLINYLLYFSFVVTITINILAAFI